MSLLLGGDIGGTKTLLALAAPDGAGRIRPLFERSYASREFERFGLLLDRFVAEARDAGHTGAVEAACIGVAGPVRGHTVKVTYLPWVIDAEDLRRRFPGAHVQLVNDFAAAAAGVLDTDALALVPLQAGSIDPGASRVVLGAGTGLGVAALCRAANHWRILSGEGGHMGFAPVDEWQARLRGWLAAREPRVTAERVLCGKGIAEIYRFLCREGAPPVTPNPLDAPDPAAAIAALGLAEPDSTCGRVLAMFCTAYGAFAGDLALLFDARGGVFIAGGIAAKILPAMQAGGFMAAFHDKGVHNRLAGNYPVNVVMEPRLGLLGTLQLAGRRGVAEA